MCVWKLYVAACKIMQIEAINVGFEKVTKKEPSHLRRLSSKYYIYESTNCEIHNWLMVMNHLIVNGKFLARIKKYHI